ncbi:MAG: hypothetical protein H5U40_06335, partial [Polyangiaceae bacterium]|nr:hypothetical protein [Polyangiaceae bacterium]
IAFFAVASTVLAFAFAGVAVGVGTALGGLIALFDFAFFRWAGVRILRGSLRTRMGVSTLLSLKLGAVGALLFLLIVPLGVHPVGLAIGLGSLYIGVVAGSGVLSSLGPQRVSGET